MTIKNSLVPCVFLKLVQSSGTVGPALRVVGQAVGKGLSKILARLSRLAHGVHPDLPEGDRGPAARGLPPDAGPKVHPRRAHQVHRIGEQHVVPVVQVHLDVPLARPEVGVGDGQLQKMQSLHVVCSVSFLPVIKVASGIWQAASERGLADHIRA